MLGSGLHNIDCMQALPEYPDKYFDLAIVDPPYGSATPGAEYNRFGGRFDKYKTAAQKHGGMKQKGPAAAGQVNTAKK